MVKGFWGKLAKPILGLSPMDGVTDAPWRFIAKKYGQPDVVFTEFVSAEGLWRIKNRKDFENKIWKDLVFDESGRPVVAQLFGSDPESFYEAAKIICDLGFDGIDINMGCPSPGLEKRGGGAGLIRLPKLARQVIEETRRGVKEWASQGEKGEERVEIPVSVKSRIGSGEPDREWWKFLASMNLPCVTIHGRTFKQLYSGEANWDLLLQASEIIRSKDTLFLANGDIKGLSKENNIQLITGKEIDIKDFDGVLIGRQAMGNPWVLRKDGYIPSLKEKLEVAIEHSKKYEEIFGREEKDGLWIPPIAGEKDRKEIQGRTLQEGKDSKNEFRFFPMRKHLAWYAHGFDGASVLRREMVMSNNSEEVEEVVERYLKN